MMIHNAGPKADRDRALLLKSYNKMVRVFRTPRKDRLTPMELAGISNTKLFQVSKDLYNAAPVRKAKRIARILGLEPARVPWHRKAAIAVLNVVIAVGHWLSRLHVGGAAAGALGVVKEANDARAD